MSARRSRRHKRGSRAYVIVAVSIVTVLVVGTIAAALADLGGADHDQRIDGDVRITPGAEIARLQTQVAADPDDIDSLIVLAEILANSGRPGEAVPLFEAAVARRPNDATLRLAFGRALLRSGNLFDAELQLERAVALDPSDQAAAFYLAQTFEAKGEAGVEDARNWYQRAVELQPDSLIAEQAREALELLGPPSTPTAVR